jgi:hypothetical protein
MYTLANYTTETNSIELHEDDEVATTIEDGDVGSCVVGSSVSVFASLAVMSLTVTRRH